MTCWRAYTNQNKLLSTTSIDAQQRICREGKKKIDVYDRNSYLHGYQLGKKITSCKSNKDEKGRMFVTPTHIGTYVLVRKEMSCITLY